MDSSGLPNPSGSSEPLSSVLLQLSSQGLKLMPPQTRFISFTTTATEHMTEQQPLQALQLPSGEQPGPSWASNLQELQNQLTKLDQHESIHQNNCQLPLDPFLNVFEQMSAEKQNGPPKSPHTSMAVGAHMNLLPQMEKQNPYIQLSLEEQLAYGLGRGAERLKQYMLQQRNRPKDNNMHFWRNFVAEFFAPGAKKRWCVSLYKNCKKSECLFSKVSWQCDLCNEKPHRGFEISEELLPRLHKMKYDIGVLEEYLQLDQPSVHQGAFGQIILKYPKAIEESEYDQVRIVRHGQLRVFFTPDFKIRSWEFCAQNHKEYIPRKSVIPQVYQLGAAMQKYKNSSEDSSSVPSEELQKSTDLIVSSAAEMIQALRMPFISNLGIVKRYQRAIQMSEVFNMMKDLIVYSHENGTSPKESLLQFPRYGSNVSSVDRQPEQDQSPPAYLATPFPTFSAAENGIALYGNGLGNNAAPTFMGCVNHKRQCVGPNSSNTPISMQNTSVRFTAGLAGQSNFSHAFTTSTSTAFEKLQQSNLSNNIDSRSSVERIIQEVLAGQPCNNPAIVTGPSVAENTSDIMPNEQKVGDGQYSGHAHIQNYEVKNNYTASTSVATTSASMDYHRLTQHAKGKQPAKKYDDELGELMEFDELQELLNYL